jgi:hypothetical protein
MNSSLFILNRRRNFYGVFDASSVGVQQHGTCMMRPYVDSCSPPCQASSRPGGNDIVEPQLDLQEKGKPKYSNAIYGRRLPLHPLAHPHHNLFVAVHSCWPNKRPNTLGRLRRRCTGGLHIDFFLG